MSAAAARRHPRDELGERRSGVRVEVYVPKEIARLIADAQARYGTKKKDVVVAALVAYFAGQGQGVEVRELLRLGRLFLARQVNGDRPR